MSSMAQSDAAEGTQGRPAVTEEIWALEAAYFTNLYKADYAGVMELVHKQFLGWPNALPLPIDADASARFMRQLVPGPTSCAVTIERAGIEVRGNVALTQYTLHVACADKADASRTQTSRITHTWVKERGAWKLLGGMSYDR
jgi:ketosteroid isomerase-like protein